MKFFNAKTASCDALQNTKQPKLLKFYWTKNKSINISKTYHFKCDFSVKKKKNIKTKEKNYFTKRLSKLKESCPCKSAMTSILFIWKREKYGIKVTKFQWKTYFWWPKNGKRDIHFRHFRGVYANEIEKKNRNELKISCRYYLTNNVEKKEWKKRVRIFVSKYFFFSVNFSRYICFLHFVYKFALMRCVYSHVIALWPKWIVFPSFFLIWSICEISKNEPNDNNIKLSILWIYR